MSNKLFAAEQLLVDFFGSYDPDCYAVDGATDLLRSMANMKRLIEAGTLRTARRLEKSHVHEREGYKNPGSWLSSVTGEPPGQAAASLENARQIEAHPEVQEAFSSGRLSEAQAKQIASVADRSPKEAARLVEEAADLGFGELKKRCHDIRSAASSAEDEIARHDKIRRSRYCRTWTDSDGAGRLEARVTPDALGVIKSSLESFCKEIFEEARTSGMRDSAQAYMADALVAMALASTGTPASCEARETGSSTGHPSGGESPGPASGPNKTQVRKPLIRVRVDLGALLRGHVIAGETCSIPGVGALPVDLVRELIPDALLELVLTNGTDVTTVVTDSRYIRRALRVALEERDPVCCVPGCDASELLEIDHWRTDVAKDGLTELDNLARLCKWHHHQKTYKHWRLEGGPGRWRFIAPDGPDPGETWPKSGNGPPEQVPLL